MLLREIQRDFTREVFENRTTPLADNIQADGIEPTRRLKIYRNNIRTTLREALQDVYTVTCALVGEEFFKFLAEKYRIAHPPTSGDITDYGGHLSEFILSIDQLSGLKYLSDIAKLDWSTHLAIHALSKTPIKIDELAKIPETQQTRAVLQMHPSASLISSEYPIFDIWKFAMDPDHAAAPANVDTPGQHVVIMLRENQTTALLLSDDLCLFVDMIAKEKTLGEAVTQLFAFNSNYNLELHLSEVFKLGLISGLTIRDN